MSLEKLSTAAYKDEVDFDNLPEQFGAAAPPPPPGAYLLELSPLKVDNFDEVDSEEYGKRVKVMFNEHAPLVIKQSVGGLHDGLPFQTTITNVPRKRGKKDDPEAKLASDWDYLNQALKEPKRPPNAKAYATALMAQASKRAQFFGDLEWSWSCNPNKAARFDDGQGNLIEMIDATTNAPTKGCGERYYQDRDVQKAVAEEGQPAAYPLRITCKCQAQVRAFANIRRFRPVEKEPTKTT